MPFYRRGYYRRGRFGYGYRGYNRSWRRRGWYRRGSLSRASMQGTRRFSCVVPTQASFNFTVAGGSYWSDLHAVNPYDARANALKHCALPSSLLYRTYTRIYDQVKIDWVSVRISIMSLVGSGGVTPAVKVVTMWDRETNITDISGDEIPTPDSIQSGSESQISLIVNNSRAVVSRFNGANDLQERTTFHDCTLASNSGAYVDAKYMSAATGVGYAPALFIALNTATAPAEGASFSFTCSLDVKWRVTFRNPKYGLSVSSSSGAKGDLTSDGVSIKSVASQSDGAGKSVAKKVTFDAGAVSDVLPTFNGLLGDVVDRLSANMHEEGVYGDGEYDHDEDIQFAYQKLGDDVFHQFFKDVYDGDLKKLGLISEKDGDIIIKEA